MERLSSEAFDLLGFMLVLFPILYIVFILIRDRAERDVADRIIRQGEAEADKQSELRRKRREDPQA